MYTAYQVVMVAEDGEYIVAEFQTDDRAQEYIRAESKDLDDGQRLIMRQASRTF